ncbi:MAG TPA: type II secretion system F family protein [Nevskiales bacterium]|nr:type II secretion system F family protein [Nevskiales bacterium]
MNVLLWLLLALLSGLLVLGAAALLLQARRREIQDEVLARLQLGLAGDETGWRRPQPVSNPVLRAACHRFWQAGLDFSAGQVAGILSGLALAALLLMLLLGLLAGLLLAGLGLVGGLLLLQQLAGRRQRQIVAQLPDFLEHVLRALIAGNTLEEAFAEAAREGVEPLRGLFLGVARQVRLGAPIEDALAQAAEVHDLPDVHVLAMTARVNRRYGGSIRNMIKSLVQVIRARGTAARELRALTAETRFSALLLFVIPLGISLFILLRNPAFYTDMWNDALGRVLLSGAAGLQLLGGLIIWRMLRSTEGGA